MRTTLRTSIQVLAAAAALTFGLCAMTLAAAESSQPLAPPHTVPTNLPGVYAFTQPPASFDPHRVTDQELLAWGYPARPGPTEGPTEWARWEQAVDPALRRVVPHLQRREGVYHRPIMGLSLDPLQSRPIATAATSSNWSGFALTPNSGAQPYSVVMAAWIVPSVKQPPHTCSGAWDYSSQWLGLGGFADAFLLQAGSAANVYCDIGANVTEYFPWIEWLPAAETVIYANAQGTLLPFAAGDYVQVTITATNWTAGASTSGTLLFQDFTQGWGISLTFTAGALGGSQVTGQSAEFIIERPEVNGSLATLPDYIAGPWWITRTQDLGSVLHFPGTPGNATAYQITMLDDSDAYVSFVDLFGVNALWFFPEGSATK